MFVSVKFHFASGVIVVEDELLELPDEPLPPLLDEPELEASLSFFDDDDEDDELLSLFIDRPAPRPAPRAMARMMIPAMMPVRSLCLPNQLPLFAP